MDEKTWHVLERNSGLLVGNMVLSEEFFRLLKTEHVLPDTMVRDIQVRAALVKASIFKLKTFIVIGNY